MSRKFDEHSLRVIPRDPGVGIKEGGWPPHREWLSNPGQVRVTPSSVLAGVAGGFMAGLVFGYAVMWAALAL